MDTTAINQLAANVSEPYAAEPAARILAHGQVVVGDIPAQRSGFQPRPALLAQLNGVRREPPVVVLAGDRGVGKTQLAAAYARSRLAAGWRVIAWLNARSEQSLLAGLAAVAEATGPPDGGPRPSAAAQAQTLRRRLEADGSRCLLVLDDAQDLDALRPFIPVTGAAQVLITRDREPVPELGTGVPVDVFSAEEARALLAGRTGLADDAGALAVAAELGYLPLTLDQAAAVIAGQRLGYQAYLAKLRTLRADPRLAGDENGAEQPHPPGGAAVLLSLEAVRAADPLGVCTGVMKLMAVLSPAAVGRAVLCAAGETGTLLGGGRRVASSMVDQALDRLDKWSLLGFGLDRQAATMHRLVARVIQDELTQQGRFAAACRSAALALETSAGTVAEPQARAAASERLDQVTALAENAGTLADDAGDELGAMLSRLRSRALHHLADLGDGRPRAMASAKPPTADLERILVDRERTLGPDHPDTLTSQNDLATAYAEAGRANEAILLFRLTLAARERLLSSDHPDTLRSRTSLAEAYHAAGRIADAIPLVRQILATRERLLGADHPSTLAARNNLASAYRSTGQPAAAVPLFEENVAACERLLGAHHPKTLASRYHLDLARQEAAASVHAGSVHAGSVDQVGGDLQDDGP